MKNRPIRIPGRRMVITKRMLESSHENTRSAAEASRWLGVSYNTYKKWAKYYGLFEEHKNQSGIGIKKGCQIHFKELYLFFIYFRWRNNVVSRRKIKKISKLFRGVIFLKSNDLISH